VVFGFLKNLNSPEAGYRAIRASYEKHYRLAQNNGIEPVSMGLFGALGSRYKLRGLFVSEVVHMMEIAPFMMMDDFARVKDLADYLMADEIPDRIDITQVRDSINDAITTTPPDNDAFQMLAAAEPYLANFPIRWVHWLTEASRSRLHEAYLADQSPE
jgi:hypothetical protein